jgi:hypothetical protein
MRERLNRLLERWVDTLGAWMFGWNPPDISTIRYRYHPLGNVGGEPVPDRISTEPITGYRVWRVVNAGDGTGLRLASMHMAYLWDRENTAECFPMGSFTQTVHPKVASPSLDCACGLYAQLPEHPISEWDAMRRGSVTASGSIAMTGRVIRCERGFKAQHATVEGPVVLEVSCMYTCDSPPTVVQIPDSTRHSYWTVCDVHKTAEPYDMPMVTVDVSAWLREACRELSERYGVEVLSWM